MKHLEINIICANYMGLEYIDRQKSHGDWGWWKKGTFKQGGSANNPNFICITDVELNYSRSWDKIHIVWDKFSKSITHEGLMYSKLCLSISQDSVEVFAKNLSESILFENKYNSI